MYRAYVHHCSGCYAVTLVSLRMKLQMSLRNLEFWEGITRQSVLVIFEEVMKLISLRSNCIVYVYTATHLPPHIQLKIYIYICILLFKIFISCIFIHVECEVSCHLKCIFQWLSFLAFKKANLVSA